MLQILSRRLWWLGQENTNAEISHRQPQLETCSKWQSLKPLNQVFCLWVTRMSKRWKLIFQNIVFCLLNWKPFNIFFLGGEAIPTGEICNVYLITLVILMAVHFKRCHKHLLYLIDEAISWLYFLTLYILLLCVHQWLYKVYSNYMFPKDLLSTGYSVLLKKMRDTAHSQETAGLVGERSNVIFWLLNE